MATEKPQVKEERKALVQEITDWLRDEREFWAPTFEDMREKIRFAGGDQWNEGRSCTKYKVNVTQRHLNQAVATTYAQNPTVLIERKKRLDHLVWDGTIEQLQRAKAEIEQAGLAALDAAQKGQEVPEPPQQAVAVVMDYEAGRLRAEHLDKIAETLQRLIEFEQAEQKPDFNGQMKQASLREKTCGVAYVAVKFQSETETVATDSSVNTGVLELMREIQATARMIEADPDSETDARKESLKQMVESLKARLTSEDAKMLRQGLVYDFKPATSILVDRRCRDLHEFVGAPRIAEVLYLTPEQVMAQWNVDIRCDGVVQYGEDGTELIASAARKGKRRSKGSSTSEWQEGSRACVAIVYDKTAQTKYVICDGYEDFLEEPDMPRPPVKGFWPIVAIKLRRIEIERNDPEGGITIYGESDVDLGRPMQEELNRSQQSLREHRKGSRPGGFFNQSISKLQAARIGAMGENDWIPLELPADGDVRKLFMEKPTVKIDPAVYSKEGVMQDFYLAVGTQSSNLGQQMGGEKATGQAIAEQSRVQGVSSEVDELDKCLTEIDRISGEMLLQGMTQEMVQTKVGKGARWPTSGRMADGTQSESAVTIDDCLEQLVIKIEAASSGRPNQAVDIQNFKEMQPLLIGMAQAMGLPLAPLVRHAAKIMQFKFDVDEWLAQAAPPMAGGGLPPGAGMASPPPPGAGTDPAGMNQRIKRGTVRPGTPPQAQPKATV